MADISHVSLGDFFNLYNLSWVVVFIGGLTTAYWRLRNFIADKNKKHMQEIAENTSKEIIDKVTNDNIVSEINLKQTTENNIEQIKNTVTAEVKQLHDCTGRLEQKLESHIQEFHKLDVKVVEHIARAEEQSKTLDRLAAIADKSMSVVEKVTPKTEN